MPAFVYEVLDENGRRKQGVLEGDSARQVRQQLREKGWTPLSVEEGRASEKRQGRRWFAASIGAGDLALVTRQLATLVQAGVPAEEALRAVGRHAENQRVSSTVLGVRGKVMEGHSLAHAMGEYPAAFPELYRATVAAGEKSGHLDLVLEKLADYTERRHDLNRTVSGALIYPVILVVMSVAIVSLLLTVAVPKIVVAFERSGQELPLATRLLMASSDFALNWGWLVLLLLGGAFVLFRRALADVDFRRRYHAWQLRMPFLRRLVRGANSARFASTLAILVRSGVPLVDALHICAEVMTNLCFREAVSHAVTRVQEGMTLNRALEQGGWFPPMLLQMVASGENSGELDHMLERAALAQEKDLQLTINAAMAAFSPLLLVFMAVLVFGIVIAMLLPIINMNAMVG